MNLLRFISDCDKISKDCRQSRYVQACFVLEEMPEDAAEESDGRIQR